MDVNQQDDVASTALMHAINKGHREVEKLLAAHPCAQLELQDLEGVDAIQLAVYLNQLEVIEILESRLNEVVDTRRETSLMVLQVGYCCCIVWLESVGLYPDTAELEKE